MQSNWYVLRTKTGHEDKVRIRLENKTQCLSILLPKTEVMVTRNGRKKRLLKPIFPGYIFVEMELNDNFWYEVKNTPGVINFISCGNDPIPVHENDIKYIMTLVDDGKTPLPETAFEVGDLARIVNGPFMGASGIISEIDIKRNKIKVAIDILGKHVAIDLDYDDIKTE
ncbi:transcription termination/antitermination factor NusG [Candidatus Poribacteria bacterium]|nr:transcription termination/antitermination factor NusG [Candidatus Poribacteria bacterium]